MDLSTVGCRGYIHILVVAEGDGGLTITCYAVRTPSAVV